MERKGAGQMNGEELEHADTWAVETFGKASTLRCVFLLRDGCKIVSFYQGELFLIRLKSATVVI
jgi:hypothetical protein